LQTAIEVGLAAAIGKPIITIWSKTEWQSKWSPAREKIVGYRNFLTHMGNPQVMLVAQPSGESVPFVIHPDHVIRGQFLNWQQQEQMYHTNPEKWVAFPDACSHLHGETITYLNDAYGAVHLALQPFLGDESYQWVWGWDTATHGRHVCNASFGGVSTPHTRHIRPMSSGSGIGMPFIPGSGQGST